MRLCFLNSLLYLGCSSGLRQSSERTTNARARLRHVSLSSAVWRGLAHDYVRLSLVMDIRRMFSLGLNIGMKRFELLTPSSQTICATKLRYIPKIIFDLCLLLTAVLSFFLVLVLARTIHRLRRAKPSIGYATPSEMYCKCSALRGGA